MKTLNRITLIAILILLQGCLVKSLRPFYTERDLVFYKSLTGTWTDQDSTRWKIEQYSKSGGLFKPSLSDSSYLITVTDEKGVGVFHAHLFCLNNKFFIDFFPEEAETGSDLTEMHLVPSHSVARVFFKGEQIQICWFNEEWLTGLFRQQRIRLAHVDIPYETGGEGENDAMIVLTVPTEDLQKFLIKYGDDPAAFGKTGENSNFDNSIRFTLTRIP